MKQEYTYFFNLTSPFSNFHPAKFVYKNVTFISNEQFMMYCKAKQFKDEETASKILSVNNWELPSKFLRGEITREEIIQDQEQCEFWKRIMMNVKRMGREVINYNDEIWNEKRYNIVKYGAKEKFEQNEDLKNILLNTGKTLMCEAASHDGIWGCGLSEYQAKKTDPKNWPGLNLLGKALDEVKNYLFLKDEKKHETVDIDIGDYIRVVNVRGDPEYMATRDEKVVVAHRGNPTLGNKHPMKNKSMVERDRVIAEHKKDLEKDLSQKGAIYNELKLIAKDIVENEQKIALSCFCAPFLSFNTI